MPDDRESSRSLRDVLRPHGGGVKSSEKGQHHVDHHTVQRQGQVLHRQPHRAWVGSAHLCRQRAGGDLARGPRGRRLQRQHLDRLRCLRCHRCCGPACVVDHQGERSPPHRRRRPGARGRGKSRNPVRSGHRYCGSHRQLRRCLAAVRCSGAGPSSFAQEQLGLLAVISSPPAAYHAMATARAERRRSSPTHRRGST